MAPLMEEDETPPESAAAPSADLQAPTTPAVETAPATAAVSEAAGSSVEATASSDAGAAATTAITAAVAAAAPAAPAVSPEDAQLAFRCAALLGSPPPSSGAEDAAIDAACAGTAGAAESTLAAQLTRHVRRASVATASAPAIRVGAAASAVLHAESKVLRLEAVIADAFGDEAGVALCGEIEVEPARFVGEERRVLRQLALARLALTKATAHYASVIEDETPVEVQLEQAVQRIAALEGAEVQLRTAQDSFTSAMADADVLRRRAALLEQSNKRQLVMVTQLEEEVERLRGELASSEVRVRSLAPPRALGPARILLAGHAALSGVYERRPGAGSTATFLRITSPDAERESAELAAWGSEQWLARDAAGFWVVSGARSGGQGGWLKSVARGAPSPIGLQYEVANVASGEWELSAELSVADGGTASSAPQCHVAAPLPRD